MTSNAAPRWGQGCTGQAVPDKAVPDKAVPGKAAGRLVLVMAVPGTAEADRAEPGGVAAGSAAPATAGVPSNNSSRPRPWIVRS